MARSPAHVPDVRQAPGQLAALADVLIPRFGAEGYGLLPERCWVDLPERAPAQLEQSWPCTSDYEALTGDLLGMGVPVPGHPGACAREGCGHAQVWHAHRTRDHACMVAGCSCAKLVCSLTAVKRTGTVSVAYVVTE